MTESGSGGMTRYNVIQVDHLSLFVANENIPA